MATVVLVRHPFIALRTRGFGTPVGKNSLRLIEPPMLPIQTMNWASLIGKNSLRLVYPAENMMRLSIDPSMSVLSGTVKDSDGNPLDRGLRIYNGDRNMDGFNAIRSSPDDGTFVMIVHGNQNDEFTIIANGEKGEHSPIYTRVKGESPTYGHYTTVHVPYELSTYVKYTSHDTFYSPTGYGVIKTSIPTNSTSYQCWITTETALPQKLNLQYSDPFLMDRILIDNFMNGEGARTDLGIRGFEVYGTNSSTAFNNTIGTDLTDLTLLGTFVAAPREPRSTTVVATRSQQAFILTNNGVLYKYAVIRFTSRHHGAESCGMRRVYIQRKVG